LSASSIVGPQGAGAARLCLCRQNTRRPRARGSGSPSSRGGHTTRIALGSDDIGLPLKNVLAEYLTELGIDFVDLGASDETPVDYPDVAVAVAREVRDGKFERGILVCGTGLGMAITANKVRGVRAATVHDAYSAERARKSNDAQIITMGSRVIGPEAAKTVLKAWLGSEFQGGNSTRKVAKISAVEEQELARQP
jgi:ribose 5-phosphate isomerase B